MSLTSDFRKNEHGAVAVLMALIGLLLILLAGASVDYGRAWYAKNQLQLAADAAVVAAATSALSEKASSVPDKAAIEKMAKDVFNLNNRNASKLLTLSPLIATYEAAPTNSITLRVSGTMRTSFVGMLGFSNIPINVVAVALRPRPGPLELVLALDTTNSMNDKPVDGSDKTTLKIDAMKAAATSLVGTLMTTSTTGAVRIGIVPYSTYANVMPQTGVPPWVIDPKERKVEKPCLKYSYPTIPGCTVGYYNCVVDGFMKVNGCYRNCLDTTKPTCVQTGEDITYKWTGCTGTRVGLGTYDSDEKDKDGKPIKVTLRLDEVIDQPLKFPYRGWRNDQASCPNSILDLTATDTVVKDKIKSLKASGDTFLPSGLVWGWNVLTPGVPYDTALSDDDLVARGGRRVLVFMTDGKNTLTARPSDGYLLANGSASLPVDWRDGSKTIALIKTLCSNIREKKITIYTILFDTNDTETQQLLKDCVGESNKPDSAPATERHFFYAKDKQSLADVFDAIGRQLMRLRISQ